MGLTGVGINVTEADFELKGLRQALDSDIN